MKTIVLSVLLLASTAASAATKCVGTTDRMTLQIEQKEGSVGVLFQMNARDFNKYTSTPINGLTINFQEGESYDVKGTDLQGLINNKPVLMRLVVNAIYSTAFFAGEEDMANVEAGDLIAKLQCQ